MRTIHVFDDIQHVYSEFVENKNYPKLERLSNWGKNRFFFNQYFKMIEDWHHTEQIVIQFNQQYFSLDTVDGRTLNLNPSHNSTAPDSF